MKVGMHITAHEPVSTAYFINSSLRPCLSLYLYPTIVDARQRLGKDFTAATNTHSRMEKIVGPIVSYATHFI
jgi:hypothetical protein